MVPDPDGAGAPSRFHARTDRKQVVRSVDPTPETLYLTRILVLQARLAEAERALAERERDLHEREQELAERKHDLQHVIDRYENVLADHGDADADRTTRGEAQQAVTDGGRTSDASATSSERRSDGGHTVGAGSRAGRLAARLRDELGLGRD
jgi:uncharacterized coiled-coil protein SlyX